MNSPTIVVPTTGPGPRGRGRPPRAGRRSTERVEILITKAERSELERIAAQESRPLAALIRDAVLEFVAERLEAFHRGRAT